MSTISFTVDTSQEAFDAVVEHLLTLKGRAYSDASASCQYLTLDGRRCAVGALIDNIDELVDECERPFEGGVDDLLAHFNVKTSIDSEMLSELQNIHDDGDSWDGDKFVAWERIWDVGRTYRLDVSNVSALIWG